MRYRLIELLDTAKFRIYGGRLMEQIADHLLSEGVIVQEQGHWIEQSDGLDGVLYTCSACRCDWCTIDGTPVENNMRYCPECGAKMSDAIERSNENAE